MNLEQQCAEFEKKIEQTTTFDELELLKNEFLGKNGTLTIQFKEMNKLSIDEKKIRGKELNLCKINAENAINKQLSFIKNKLLNAKLESEKLDMSLPVGNPCGGLHLLTREIRRIKTEYNSRGYLVLDGPEVETEFFNFDALNIPKYHPARQSQDTFYLKNFNETLLRTQTSSVQIRALQRYGVPLRMISIGKTYRNDQLDATHSPMFHQVEGLVVDRTPISIGHLQKALRDFVAFLFETDNATIRFRPSFFPFTEPGMEFDCCYKKNGNKIELTNDGDKWLELGGAGMVHPNVFKNCNIDEKLYGFAFGIGIERLVMLKYGINDIRMLFENDSRWLKYYAN